MPKGKENLKFKTINNKRRQRLCGVEKRRSNI